MTRAVLAAVLFLLSVTAATAQPAPTPGASPAAPAITPEQKRHLDDLFAKAVALQKAGDLDAALDLYNQYLAIRQDQAVIYENRALIYVLKKDYAAALADADKAIALNPNLARPYHIRGAIHQLQNKCDLAMPDLDHAIALGPFPDLPKSYGIRGLCFLRAKNYLRAIAELSHAILLDTYGIGL